MRSRVGPPEWWDLAAGLQFSLLFAIGLREEHRLLDIGCGALRGGRLFIPYLAAGNYYGIEPYRELVEGALDTEVGHDICTLKRPHFEYRDDFDFGAFGTTFDFMVAQSILSHTRLDLASRLFDNAARTLNEHGVLCATFFLKPRLLKDVERTSGMEGSGWVESRGVNFSWRELEAIARDSGLAVQRLQFPHPRQTWFAAVHHEQRSALRRISQVSGSWSPLRRSLRRAEVARRAKAQFPRLHAASARVGRLRKGA